MFFQRLGFSQGFLKELEKSLGKKNSRGLEKKGHLLKKKNFVGKGARAFDFRVVFLGGARLVGGNKKNKRNFLFIFFKR